MWSSIKKYVYQYFHNSDGSLDTTHIGLAICFFTGLIVFSVSLAIDVYFVYIGKRWDNFKEAAGWSTTMCGGGVAGQIFKNIGEVAASTAQRIKQYSDDSRYNSEPGKPVGGPPVNKE